MTGMSADEISYRFIPYSLAVYNFPAIVMTALGESDLSKLGSDANIAVRTRENDQDTQWHRRFYASFDQWRSIYVEFVQDVISTLFAQRFYYQAVPTFRVHLPHNLAVGEFHTDGDYGHPDGEINFWLPLTPAFDTNSIWIERVQGRSDFQCVNTGPGNVVAFDATHLKHGNLKNETGRTRVSFDFRCLPVTDYCAIDHPPCSVNCGLPFIPGS